MELKQISHTDKIFLKTEWVILVDISGSMATRDCAGHSTRFDSMKTLVTNLLKYPLPRTKVVFFNESIQIPDTEDIWNDIRPGGMTKTEDALEYCSRGSKSVEKSIKVLILTDGPPMNPSTVEAILRATPESTFVFCQIGRDMDCLDYLKHLRKLRLPNVAVIDYREADDQDNLAEKLIVALTAMEETK